MEIKEFVSKGGIRSKVGVPEGEKLPLLVFLHGRGEVGSNLELVMRYGPLKQVKDGVDIGFKGIICHPQLPSGTWSSGIVDDVIMSLGASFSVDFDRIYLIGVSLGGLGVWTYMQNPNVNHKIAAFVSICCGGNDPSKAQIVADSGVPGWACHGTKDTVVSISVSERMVDAVNKAAGRPQIHFTRFIDLGHVIWNRFLNPPVGVYEFLNYCKRGISRSVKLTAGQSIKINDLIISA